MAETAAAGEPYSILVLPAVVCHAMPMRVPRTRGRCREPAHMRRLLDSSIRWDEQQSSIDQQDTSLLIT
jgi:hypothetical protein